jgi:UDP-3-O-[3-hydroxymyristoyl] glucosamine N-acyltransferase
MMAVTSVDRDPPRASPALHTTGSLAALLGAELAGPDSLAIHGLATIDDALPGQLTFIRSARYAGRWAASGATAALVSRGVAVPGHDPAARALLVVADAEASMLALLRAFAPPPPIWEPGVHPTAVVDPTATIGPGASIGPFSVVGPRTTIGAGVALVAQVYLGADVRLGDRSVFHPGVRVLDRCEVGADCELWPNVVIGADGFGYQPDPAGRGVVKIPHLGNVVLGDRVEIGANSSVDRGKFGSTTIGWGSKIDNHCQIGHNCVVGRSVIICGMAGIAGSVRIGDGAVIAGHVGIADNLEIGERAVVAAKSGVISNVPPGETWFGIPAGPHRDQLRSLAALRRLPDELRRLARLEETVNGRLGAPPAPPGEST